MTTQIPAVVPEQLLSSERTALLEFESPLARIRHDIQELFREQEESGRDYSEEIARQDQRYRETLAKIFSDLTPWETVQVARHSARPQARDYIDRIVRDFCELHGDRTFGDDQAIITGFGRIGSHKVMLIAQHKGRDLKERLQCNFGCAHPEGYRKALQKMRLAEKFGVPVVCLIDTAGAYPGIGSEERGVASAIATNLFVMSGLRTPIVCAVLGEGGSGGALGIGVGDRIAMFKHAFYSVISPEGCAAILWKSGDQARLAADSLKLTADELHRLKIVDGVIKEPLGGAHRDPMAAAHYLEEYVTGTLKELKRLKIETVLQRRQRRLRQLGSFFEEAGSRGVVEVERSTPRDTLVSPLNGRRGGARRAPLPRNTTIGVS